MSLPLVPALIATVICGAVIFALRAFPFILFSRKDPPALIRFIEQYIPSMVIACLLVYCFKDLSLTTAPFGAPSLVALAVCVVLHLWKRNAMVSIFGSTALYMVLNAVW